MTRTLLLTGRPAVGKTTVIKTVAQALGKRAAGFYTEEIRGPCGREGFRLVGLHGGRATLAHVTLRKAGSGRPRVGRYGVDVAALDRIGVVALERAAGQGQVVIIDEIGKMELFSEAFKNAVLAAMDGQVPVVATVMARPHPWVDVLKAKSGVTLWQVTAGNRARMPLQVLDWLRQPF